MGEDEICMLFDDHGNAVDSFPYTAEELRKRADALDGVCQVTFDPSPFLAWPNGDWPITPNTAFGI